MKHSWKDGTTQETLLSGHLSSHLKGANQYTHVLALKFRLHKFKLGKFDSPSSNIH